MTNAFFYEGEYYLLPPDCGTVEELLARHGDGKKFDVPLLREKESVAPYFLAENIKEKSLRINPDQVYPAQVEVMPEQEYRRRLLQDSALRQYHNQYIHHKHRSARSVQKSPGEDLPVNRWIKTFVKTFGSLGLEEAIDRGDADQAEQLFANSLKDMVTTVFPSFYMGKEQEKYCLYFLACASEETALFYFHLACRLAEKYHKTWRILNYIPQGFYAPQAKRPQGVVFDWEFGVQPCIHLTIYAPEEEQLPAYLWLCGLVGEDALRNVCGDYTFVSPDSRSQIQPPESLAPAVKQIAAREPALLVPPVRMVAIPSRKNGLYGLATIRLPGVFNEFICPLAAGKLPQDIWHTSSLLQDLPLPVARLVVHGKGDFDLVNSVATGKEPCTEMVRRTLMEELANVILPIAQTIAEDTVEVWSLVLNREKLLDKLHRFAPAFQRYPGKLWLYTANRTAGGCYQLDYAMTRQMPEPVLWDNLEDEAP